MIPPDQIAQRFTRSVIVLALIGALANIAGALVVPGESQAIRTHSSGSLAALLGEEQTFVAQRYLLYGQLRELAAGGTMVVPRDVLDTTVLTHLSGLEVEVAPNRGRIAEGRLRRLPEVVRHRGVIEYPLGSTELAAYIVAVADDAPGRLITYVTRDSDTILIVDAATAASMELP